MARRRRGGSKVGISSGSACTDWVLVDYEYTSLKPYVAMFEKHVAAILRDTRGSRKGEQSASRIDLCSCTTPTAVKEETMDF